MRNRWFVLVLALAVVLALGGCKSDSGDGSTQKDDGAEETTGAADGTAAYDASWLEGTWGVDHLLTAFQSDIPQTRDAADQPYAEWTCTVDGDTLTLATEEHTYEGPVTTDDGKVWFYSTATDFVDDEGTTWTSTIDVTITKLGNDDFAATMLGTISSDTEGVLYTAQWSQTGRRL